MENKETTDSFCSQKLLKKNKIIQNNYTIYNINLNKDRSLFLNDYKILESYFFPGAGYMELAASVIIENYNLKNFLLRDMRIKKTLILDDKITKIKVEIIEDNQIDKTIIGISSFNKYTNNYVSNSTFLFDRDFVTSSQSLPNINFITSNKINANDFYSEIRKNNINYGPSFRNLENIEVDLNQALANINTREQNFQGFQYHPVIIYSAFQLFTLFLAHRSVKKQVIYLPSFIENIFYYKPGVCTNKVSIILENNIAKIFLINDEDLLMRIDFGITELNTIKIRELQEIKNSIKSKKEIFRKKLYSWVLKTVEEITQNNQNPSPALIFELSALIVISATRIVSIF